MSRRTPPRPSAAVLVALASIVEYLYYDERQHYFELPPEERGGHIFDSLVLLDDWQWSVDPAQPGLQPQ